MDRMKQQGITKTLALRAAGLLLLAMLAKSTAADAAVFEDGSLLQGSGPPVFAIENGIRRWIKTADIFNKLELNWHLIRRTSDAELGTYPEGEGWNDSSRYPDGILVKSRDSEKVYALNQNVRRWIPTPEAFAAAGYQWRNVHTISPDQLKRIWHGSDIAVPPSRSASPPSPAFVVTPPQNGENPEVRFTWRVPVSLTLLPEISFDTLLENVDRWWVQSSQQERWLRLPEESGTYRFYVRAKNRDGLASLPVFYAFSVRLSPHYHVARISWVNGGAQDPEQERLWLTNASREPITLSGWTLEGIRGTRYTIPKAVNLPLAYSQDSETPLAIPPGGGVLVASGRGQLQMNFRLNRCMGYLQREYRFDPGVSGDCPRPRIEDLVGFSEACINFLRGQWGCPTPNLQDIRIAQDSACVAYAAEHYSYGGCLRDFGNDPSVYLNEWRVYLRLSSEAWQNSYDTIILRDPQGFLVDRTSYGNPPG